MEELIIALMSILIASLVMGLGYLIYKFIKIRKNIKHRKKQAENLRFIQVRIPKNAVARNSDIDAKDHANSMKDNIALMNQVYKNFYAIYEKDLEDGKLGNNYISMEILSEKEVIKVIMAVPKDHIFTIQKMISSFYSGAVVQLIEEPKLLDFGKYYAGGEFKLTKDSVHPIKTYEAFEADPMDSILSAFSSVSREEKLCLQIIVEPLSEDWLKKMRKKCEEVKNDDGLKGFAKFWNRLTKDQKKTRRRKRENY